MTNDLAARARRIDELAAVSGEEATFTLAETLRESSWYLRERAVAALARRGDALASVIGVVESGAWYAKASGCDALGRLGDIRAFDVLVRQLLDRNVSVQKSAADAVRRLVERHGRDPLVRAMESLAPSAGRATAARLAHQVPDLADALAESFALSAPDSESDPLEEVAALRRFRAWLASTVAAADVE